MQVTFDQDVAAATVVVEGTEWSSTITRVVVERFVDGVWTRIRGGAIVTTGWVAVSDSEMPLFTTVQYRVTGYNGSTWVQALTGTVSTEIVGGSCCTFIKKAGDPNSAVCVPVMTDTLTVDSSTQGGVYDIANGGTVAVAAWSGVNADRFTLPVRTGTKADTDALRTLLQTRVLLFQSCKHEPYPSGWYYIEGVSHGLRGGGQIVEGREWQLSLVRTGVPSGDTAGVAGASWDQVLATYATWADLLAAKATWFDVMVGD